MQQNIHDEIYGETCNEIHGETCNETWQWDDEKAVESSGAQAQQEMDALLMQVTGTHSNEEADAVLLAKAR